MKSLNTAINVKPTVIFLLVFLPLSFLFSLTRAESTLELIKLRGELIWGGDMKGGEPYVYEDPHNRNKIIGFEVDIAEELAKRLGVKVRFHQNDWSSLVPSLERGDFDIALNGMEATTERADRVLLSEPYFVYAETLAVHQGSTARSLEDLKGKRVGTLNQTYAYDLLKERGFDPVIYEGDQEAYWDLANGKLDGVLLDNIIADRYGCPVKGVECLPDEVARGIYVILLRKTDTELKTAIDGAIDSMKKDGTLEKILKHWNLWDHRQTEPPPSLSKVDLPKTIDWSMFVLFLKGAWTTLEISFASFVIAVPLGFLLSLGRIYGRRFSSFLAASYVEVFRGTPVLLQLYVLYYGIAPFIKLGPMEACILGLGLNYAAYEAEIYRGAILSIPRGQSEAAHSLGLSNWETIRHVLVPQAFRVALPPMTNDFIALLKDSSLVGVIAVVELTKRMTLAATELRSWLLPGLLCGALYFILSFPLARFARRLEKRLQRDLHPRPA